MTIDFHFEYSFESISILFRLNELSFVISKF